MDSPAGALIWHRRFQAPCRTTRHNKSEATHPVSLAHIMDNCAINCCEYRPSCVGMVRFGPRQQLQITALRRQRWAGAVPFSLMSSCNTLLTSTNRVMEIKCTVGNLGLRVYCFVFSKLSMGYELCAIWQILWVCTF